MTRIVSIYHNSIHTFVIEMFKVVNGTSSEWSFQTKKPFPYNRRHTSKYFVNPILSVYNGTESASYLGSKIWKQIRSEIWNKKSLEGFKWEIKKCNQRTAIAEFAISLSQTSGSYKINQYWFTFLTFSHFLVFKCKF